MSTTRDEQIFWQRAAAPTTVTPLVGRHRTQIAIVGGGLSGLSAAYHLIKERPALDIMLLEANTVGSGASGRNTGMLGPGVGGTVLNLSRKFGDVQAKQMYQATLDAVNHVIKIIREEEIACDLEICGQLKVARTQRQAQKLRQQAGRFQALGFDVPYLDKTAVAELIRTTVYEGALYYTPAALIDPLHFCLELKRLIQQYGVRVYENTPVMRIGPGNPTGLELPNGNLIADRIILATNAYTAQLQLLQGQVVPLHTHILLTASLSSLQLANLGWRGREAIVESHNFFNYYRLTPDNRILFGGGSPVYRAAADNRYTGAICIPSPTKIWQKQSQELIKLFPTLSGIAIDQCWSGTMGFTVDMLPIVGQLTQSPNIFFTGGWNGHGVALATASGATIADLVNDRISMRTKVPWVRQRAPKLPPDPLRSIGISTYLAILQLADYWSNRHVYK